MACFDLREVSEIRSAYLETLVSQVFNPF
jgi:hypothetical protein